MDQIKVNVGGLKVKDPSVKVFTPPKPHVSQSHQPKPDIYQIAEQKKREREVEEIKQISAKLHPEYDQDLIKMIKEIPKRERSKIYRDALRMFLAVQR